MRSPMAVMAVAALLLLLVSLSAAADTTDSPEGEWEHEKIQELHRQVLADWEAGHGKDMRSEKETRRVFADWKAKHGKKYGFWNWHEEKRRYAAFKERLRMIDLHEAAFGHHSFFTIDGPFSDKIDEECRAMTQGAICSIDPYQESAKSKCYVFLGNYKLDKEGHTDQDGLNSCPTLVRTLEMP